MNMPILQMDSMKPRNGRAFQQSYPVTKRLGPRLSNTTSLPASVSPASQSRYWAPSAALYPAPRYPLSVLGAHNPLDTSQERAGHVGSVGVCFLYIPEFSVRCLALQIFARVCVRACACLHSRFTESPWTFGTLGLCSFSMSVSLYVFI